jgi:hypothetical protein
MGEAFYRDQEEGLAGAGRQIGEICGGPLLPGESRARLGDADGGGGKKAGKELIECDAVVGGLRENRNIGDQGFQGGDAYVIKAPSDAGRN